MATITMNIYEEVSSSTGSITVVSDVSDACERVIIVDVDPGSETRHVNFQFKYGTASVFPPAGDISSITQYTITMEGYQSPYESDNVTGVKASISLLTQDESTTIDSKGWIRETTGNQCGEVVIEEPGGNTADPVDENDIYQCTDCIYGGSGDSFDDTVDTNENTGNDFNDNDGFGHQDWGGFDEIPDGS